MSKKPIRLRKPELKHRIIFWASIGLAAVLIVIGWMLTVQQVLKNDIVQLRSQLDTSIEQALDTVSDFSGPTRDTATEEIDEFKENLDIFYEAIEDGSANTQ